MSMLRSIVSCSIPSSVTSYMLYVFLVTLFGLDFFYLLFYTESMEKIIDKIKRNGK
jgi:hypothetical protein